MVTVPVRQQGHPFIRYAFTFLPLTTDVGYDIRRYHDNSRACMSISLSDGRGLCSFGEEEPWWGGPRHAYPISKCTVVRLADAQYVF
ncbi:hypothetical protein [Candidatus Methanoperedens nitratireducens]|uniref:hypothetical protein n=1 Tax=Candidatus Methanoperedens nitratireducens TaxID=1392998 RepID=UPI00117837F6|nr:hypothetical protein [Candidatus Methanoperedens nitroreducens]